MEDKTTLKNRYDFDYYYEQESDQYIFHRIPKLLFADDKFENLSVSAKVVYGFLLDRMGLSAKKGWRDRNGRVYIYFTNESVAKLCKFSVSKVTNLFKELDLIGLIERKQQGQGKPAMIYVKNFAKCHNETAKTPTKDVLTDETDDFHEENTDSTSLDYWKSRPNNTKYNNTEFNDTEINQSINPISLGAVPVDTKPCHITILTLLTLTISVSLTSP